MAGQVQLYSGKKGDIYNINRCS